MKKIKVSMLALAVLVGGAVFASAAASKVIVASTSDIAVTNVAPLVWSDVSTIPSSPFINSTNLDGDSIVIVNTDGSGKISGVVNIVKNWMTTGTNPTFIAQSSLYGNVSGKISATTMNAPKTQVAIKAQGYSSPTTNLLAINNQPANSGASKLSVNFTSTAAPLPINTNDLNDCVIAGTSKIQFTPGITAITTSSKSFSEPATLQVFKNIMPELDFQVVVFGNKFAVIGQGGNLDGATGTGSVNSKSGAYSVNLKDSTGRGGNSTLQLKGTVAAFSYITPGATNSITTISTAAEKGKLEGQAVTGQGYWARFSNFND